MALCNELRRQKNGATSSHGQPVERPITVGGAYSRIAMKVVDGACKKMNLSASQENVGQNERGFRPEVF